MNNIPCNRKIIKKMLKKAEKEKVEKEVLLSFYTVCLDQGSREFDEKTLKRIKSDLEKINDDFAISEAKISYLKYLVYKMSDKAAIMDAMQAEEQILARKR